MADTLITNLTAGDPAQSGDELVANRGGSDVKLTAGSIAALAGGLPLQLPIQDAFHYGPFLARAPDSTVTLDSLADLLIAQPFMSAQAKTWTRIGLSCQTGNSGALARLGIYSSGADGLPDELIAGGTELDLSSSGELEETISVALAANTRYWLAFAGNADAVAEISVWMIGASSSDAYSLGRFMFGTEDFDDDTPVGVQKEFTYAALPASFGAIDDYWAGNSPTPYIWLRTGV